MTYNELISMLVLLAVAVLCGWLFDRYGLDD